MTTEEKRKIVVTKLRGILQGDTGEKLSEESIKNIIETWFVIQNQAFGSRTPAQMLENDFERLTEYVEYLERSSLHEKPNQLNHD